MIHREHALQRGVVVFCRRCIAVPHEFAAHDRAPPRSEHDFEWQVRRGIRAGWPDTELVLPDGKTFRVELKAPKVRFDDESRQADVLHRLNELGHQSTWANSVAMYGQQCERFGVPLHANWRTVAQLIDEHVAAEIRAETVKKAKPKVDAAVVKFRTIRRGRPTVAQIRTADAGRHLP
jgi:hypothetical protein